MKTLIAACALLGLLINPALAANEQQNKMATCNKDATGKKGDERKAFMRECLSSLLRSKAKPCVYYKDLVTEANRTGPRGQVGAKV